MTSSGASFCLDGLGGLKLGTTFLIGLETECEVEALFTLLAGEKLSEKVLKKELSKIFPNSEGILYVPGPGVPLVKDLYMNLLFPEVLREAIECPSFEGVPNFLVKLFL